MYGFSAINASNGWAISVVGISIVFSGLVMLSLVISQLYKILGFWSNLSEIKIRKKFKRRKRTQANNLPFLTENQKEISRQLLLIAQITGNQFSIERLMHLAQISDVQEPKQHIDYLLETKIIISDGLGQFAWDKEKFDSAIQSK